MPRAIFEIGVLNSFSALAVASPRSFVNLGFRFTWSATSLYLGLVHGELTGA